MNPTQKLEFVKAQMQRDANEVVGQMAKIEGVPHPEVVVTFSNRLVSAVGRCFYWETPSRIQISVQHLSSNLDNPAFIHRLIIHEAAHIFHPNHGSQFRDLCAALGCPDEGPTTLTWREQNIVVNGVEPQGHFKCPFCKKVTVTKVVPTQKRIKRKKCPLCKQRGLIYYPTRGNPLHRALLL